MNTATMDQHIRIVDLEAPARWLFAGWDDFKRAPAVSLTYGALFSATGLLMVWAVLQTGMVYLVMPLVGGFALLAPFLALGLYEVSRKLEQGQQPTFANTWDAWKNAPQRLGIMAVGLLIVMMAWFLIGSLVFGVAMGSGTHSYDGILAQLTTPLGFSMIVLGSVIGLIFAAVVFLGTAVSVPMVLDRDIDAHDAVALSARVVMRNRHVMWSWAFTIAILIWFALSLAMVGLMIAMPVLAYATWHAYRELMPAAES